MGRCRGFSLDGLRALLASQPDPFDRAAFRPGHVTASGFVVGPDGRAVVLIEHLRLRRWLQPGGHIEPGDATPESAARREIAEETGMSSVTRLGLLDIDVHRYPERGADPAHLHYDVRWGYRAAGNRISAGDGVRAVRWVPLSEALEMDESIARPVRKLVIGDW